ncbi:MAG: hypothetical protein K6B65_07300 [Bacilli bacterium]|nr:hypothetical protein [Bacilli bacterium]
MDNKTKTLNYLINLSFFLYFLVLLTERILSVVLSIVNGINLYDTGFHAFVYTTTFVSIGIFFLFLISRCGENIKALFKMKNEPRYRDLIIAAGILLVSGMVHTEYTISYLQFVSYAFWIAGIVLEVVLHMSYSNDRPLSWLSLAYVIAFSMAIPVMYQSNIEQRVAFHILEALSTLSLVMTFTYLVRRIFKGRDDAFLLPPVLLVVVLDVILIALRWNEEINYFVLVFVSITLLLFIAGTIYKIITRRNKDN